MSFQITTAFVDQYRTNVEILSQQMGSVLRDHVRIESVVGDHAFFEQIGAVTATDIVTRHADTPLISTPHARRRVSLLDAVWADLIDDLDKVKMLIDPQNPYAKNGALALGRKIDLRIIAAATGTAYTDHTGSTATVLPTAQKIVNASAGLTIAKLRAARKILRQGNVDPSIALHIAVSADEIDDLLGTTQVTSSDYNVVKALVNGEVNSFMGFEFHHTELLSEASSVRTCFAWAEDGILLALGKDIYSSIEKRVDKNDAIQVLVKLSIGATRMEEVKVVQIDCYHA